MLVKAQEQPATVQQQDPDRATPPGVVVVPILPQQPHTDTTALFQSGGLIRNKAALTGIGDSCGCMEYGYTRYAFSQEKRNSYAGRRYRPCHKASLDRPMAPQPWVDQ